jgi:anti-repressor protein
MSTQVVPYFFEGQSVRILQIGGQPWWVLADVCRVLHVNNPSDVAERLENDERQRIDLAILDTIEGNPVNGLPGSKLEAWAISESGLYAVILTSRKEEAKRFRRWVTGEVLPKIRQTGTFSVTDPLAYLLNDPAALRVLLLSFNDKVTDLQAQTDAMRPQVAACSATIRTRRRRP